MTDKLVETLAHDHATTTLQCLIGPHSDTAHRVMRDGLMSFYRAALASRPDTGAVARPFPVWDVREIEDCGHRGMKGYQVLLPDGTWTDIAAHNPEDAIAQANLDWRAAHPPAAVAGDVEQLAREIIAKECEQLVGHDAAKRWRDTQSDIGMSGAMYLRAVIAALNYKTLSQPAADAVGTGDVPWHGERPERICEAIAEFWSKFEDERSGGAYTSDELAENAGEFANDLYDHLASLASTKSPDADGGKAPLLKPASTSAPKVCYCKVTCGAPVIMGRQAPCIRGFKPGSLLPSDTQAQGEGK